MTVSEALIQQHDAAAEGGGDPDVVVAVNGNAPRHVDLVVGGEALRRGLPKRQIPRRILASWNNTVVNLSVIL